MVEGGRDCRGVSIPLEERERCKSVSNNSIFWHLDSKFIGQKFQFLSLNYSKLMGKERVHCWQCHEFKPFSDHLKFRVPARFSHEKL